MRVTGDVYVQAGASPILTLAPGLTLEFDAGGSLWIGDSADGGLVAIGTPAAPITLTSSAAAKALGDWDGLVLRSG